MEEVLNRAGTKRHRDDRKNTLRSVQIRREKKMRKEEKTTAEKQEVDLEVLQLVLASTRQQLSQAMAVSAELDARLVLEQHKTKVLLDQLAERSPSETMIL